MIHISRLVSVLAGIALALAPATASPAGPGQPGAPSLQLRWLVCASGTATTGTLTGLPNADQPWRAPGGFTPLTVGMDLQLSPCRTPDSTHGYAVAIYSPTRSVGTIYKYQNLAQGGLDRLIMEVEPTDHAMCLLARNDIRLDCFEIDWETNADGGVRPHPGARLAVDSPLVNMSAIVNMFYSNEDGPGCPTCD